MVAVVSANERLEARLTVLTVDDVIKLALPSGTTVVAGRAGLDREVTWAARIRSSPPAFGHLAGGELVLLPELLADIEGFFSRTGRQMTENNRRQAYIPSGAIPVRNPVGTAPASTAV